ncbi:MAG: hypothetical protein P1P85_01170 [Patescibacteria group bacterium]|nr:hypothetical protein [Patescibacteria group bacterium]
MKNYKKIAILSFLLLVVFSFSGCSIKKIEDIKDNAVPKVEKKEEVKNIDTDKDGLLDSEEKEFGTDINNADTDGDGLTDFIEIRNWKTNPLESDTDGDGYFDGQEVEGGYDPLGPGQLDLDSDGLGDADEKKAGTNPENPDTDNDGFNDKEEIDLGRDPLVAEVE